jgi:hypothetical protein
MEPQPVVVTGVGRAGMVPEGGREPPDDLDLGGVENGSPSLRYSPDMPYEPHSVFTVPNDRTPIWRYVDFARLMSMLVTRSLFFCRSDLLDDRFEGSMSRANLLEMEQAQPELSANAREQLVNRRRADARRTFINSWTMGRYESVALWRLYVGDRDGVAIRSSFGRLAHSFEAEPRPVHVGAVHYIDYETDPIPDDYPLRPFLYKRTSFDFERELRAVMPASPDEEPPGVFAACELATLVSAIRVSPASGRWFAPLVRSVLEKYGLDVPVEESNLLANPVY